MLAIAAFATSFVACDENETTPDGPTITAPAVIDVQASGSVDVTFSITVPGGFKSYELTATGGTAAKKSEPAAGAATGDIVVTYTADAAEGAGTVTITVIDNNGKTESETAAVNKAEEITTITVSSNISTNTTWKTGKTYILASRIAVVDGVTLTIESGVVVKGEAGTGANATALIIARGGKIMAEGTQEAPIIFTSVADEIQPGQIVSPNLDADLSGLWGGLLVLGRAPISADAESVQIEGIPPSDQNGLYGGNVADDNSGVIKYVSIRHGGANIGEGNEINGLTLGGVGTGTVIENVEVVANQDDGIEWFGGTVNVTNALVWNAGDDAIDTDQSWAGTLDNFVVINAGDETFELDGPEGAFEAGHVIKNGWINAGAAEGLIDLDDNSMVTLENIYFFNLADGQDVDQNCEACTFTVIEATLPAGLGLANFFKDGTDAFVTSVSEGANTVGADLTAFEGWSWAAVNTELK